MTDEEIIRRMVDLLQQFPTGLDELVGDDVYQALEEKGYLY